MTMYGHDFHQCDRCGCRYPSRTLRELTLVDNVLRLTSTVYQCTDSARCARMKAGREEILAREREGEVLAAAVPIRGKGKR